MESALKDMQANSGQRRKKIIIIAAIGFVVACVLGLIIWSLGQSRGKKSEERSAAAALAVPAYAAHSIDEGSLNDGPFTPAFSIDRKEGEAVGVTIDKALDNCLGRDKSLCTDTQWSRACAADSALASIETWTLSTRDEDFVVRGGSDCSARKVSKPTDKSDARAGVCCDRAVPVRALESDGDKSKERQLVQDTAKKLLDYEVAIRTRDYDGLTSFFDETVTHEGKDLSRDVLVKDLEKELASDPKHLAIFDDCKVKVEQDEIGTTTVIDCTLLTRKHGKLKAAPVRVVRGSNGAVQFFGDPALTKKGERKEKASSFIPTK